MDRSFGQIKKLEMSLRLLNIQFYLLLEAYLRSYPALTGE
jgi:hypothetical protein